MTITPVGPGKIGDISIHPMANLLPMMSDSEIESLAMDIKQHGQQEPIVMFEGSVVDGRNRLRACAVAKVSPTFTQFDGRPDGLLAFVLSANLHRRHLTAEQQREIIARRVVASPEVSDRTIAKEVKASPTTVGKVRAQLEAEGQVSTVDARTGADGKKQTARKAKPATSRPATVGKVPAQHKAKGQVSTVDTRTGADEKKQPARKSKTAPNPPPTVSISLGEPKQAVQELLRVAADRDIIEFWSELGRTLYTTKRIKGPIDVFQMRMPEVSICPPK